MATEKNIATGKHLDLLTELYDACSKSDTVAVESLLSEIKENKYDINALIEFKSGGVVLSHTPAFFGLGIVNVNIDNQLSLQQIKIIQSSKKDILEGKQKIAEMFMKFEGFYPKTCEEKPDGTKKTFAEFVTASKGLHKMLLGENGPAEMQGIVNTLTVKQWKDRARVGSFGSKEKLFDSKTVIDAIDAVYKKRSSSEGEEKKHTDTVAPKEKESKKEKISPRVKITDSDSSKMLDVLKGLK
jgi:hypothetical protein